MKRPLLSLIMAALLLAGCARGTPESAPVSAPSASEPTASAPAPSGPTLLELRQEAKAVGESLGTAKEATAYGQAWPKYLAALTALLAHPDAWSLGKDAPVTLLLDQPDLRVYKAEGTYLYLQDDPTRITLWAVLPSGTGLVLHQLKVGADLAVDAFGDLLVLTAVPANGLLIAWERSDKGFVPAAGALAGIGSAVGSVRMTASGGTLTMDSGWWRRFSADGKPVYGQDGAPFLCPTMSSPLETCYRLTAEQGRLVFRAPAPGGSAALADPQTIKANLSIGYKDDGSGAPAAEALEAANRALAGLREYLQKPLDQQVAPAAFRQLLQGSAPGSVKLLELAPNVRVYDVTTRPDYNPQGYALLQWWEDPARPQLLELELGMFAGLWEAALFYGSEGERVLVYSAGTFPTRHNTGRTLTVLRYDAGKLTWVPDERAFAAKLPERVGGVALNPLGATLSMYRPSDPPMRNRVELDPKAQSLLICDTDQLCLTLEYRNNTFTPKQ